MSAMNTNGDVRRHGKADDVSLAGYGDIKTGGRSLRSASVKADFIHPIKAPHMNGVENSSLTPELMALEEQFRMVTSIFENASEGIMIMDANGAIRCVNPALCAATGYSVGDLVGKTPAILNSGRHDESFYDDIWKSLGGTGKWRGEVWNKRKNGEIYPTWLSISAIKDSSGRATQYMSISVDISSGRKNGEPTIVLVGAGLALPSHEGAASGAPTGK